MFVLLVVVAIQIAAGVIIWLQRAVKADSGTYTKTWSSGDLAWAATMQTALLAAVIVALVLWV